MKGISSNPSYAASGTDASISGGEWTSADGHQQDLDREAMAGVVGIILAGTQPWGACALERIVPRGLAPIANRPLLTHILGWLAGSGVGSVSICGNSYTRVMRRSLGRGAASSHVPVGLGIEYYEDLAPRGPAGCVRDAGLGSGCETLVVVDGSLMPQIDLRDLVAGHARTGAALTVVVSGDRQTGGGGTEGRPPMGIYVFSRQVLDHISPTGYQDIKETLIPNLYRAGLPVMPHPVVCPVPRVTSVASYIAVNAWALKTLSKRSGGFEGYRFEGYRINGETGVHLSASVDPTARLIGPVLIGERSRVGRGATIVGPTSIGTDCRIDDGAVICRTAIWDECTVESGSVLDRCILTSRSSVGGESAYRYVVFSETPARFPGLGKWLNRRGGSNGSASCSKVHAKRPGSTSSGHGE